MTENEIQKQVKEYLNSIDVCFIEHRNENYRKKNPNKKQKGLPDLQIVSSGRSMFLEIKNIDTSSKTYKEQVDWRNKLTKAGCACSIRYGFEDCKQAIDEFLRR